MKGFGEMNKDSRRVWKAMFGKIKKQNKTTTKRGTGKVKTSKEQRKILE